jgi:hypothetical protein
MVTIFNSGGIQIDSEQGADGDGKLIYNNFIGSVLSDFAQIVKLATGRALVAALKAELESGKTLIIGHNMKVALVRGRRAGLHGGMSLLEQMELAKKKKEDELAKARSDGTTQSNDSHGRSAGPGVAVDGVTVTYDPIDARYENAAYENPTWIVLAHELIHALHYLTGTKQAGESDHLGKSVLNEELQTVGLGKFAGGGITENSLRAEAKLKPRLQY